MLKTIINSVDIYYILLVILCVSFIVLYGNYRCKKKDKINDSLLFLDGKPIFVINDFKLGRWHITHMLFFALLGYLYPKSFYLSMFGGICWEIVEFSLGHFKPDWFYNNWCHGVNSSNEWWYYQYSDIFANLIGFLIGMNLSKIM